MPRELDADFVEVVRLFRCRRRWRHVIAMIIGGVALILGTAIVGARLTDHSVPGLASLRVGVGLYLAGALLSGWGGARGFTRRLAIWLPACLVFGVLAVLVFAVAAVFSGEADSVIFDRGSATGSARTVQPVPRPASASASSRVLAAELLDRSDLERLLGPAPADLQTPGEKIARARSLAIWRAVPPGVNGGPRQRGPRPAAVSLTVQYSARQARRLRSGRRPAGADAIAGLGEGGYLRRHDGSAGRVTRVRAGRGDWVVSLQLRTPAAGDPAPLLAADVNHALGLLIAASAGVAATAREAGGPG